jgi:hypothetical protein
LRKAKKTIHHHTPGHSPMVISPIGESHIWQNSIRPLLPGQTHSTYAILESIMIDYEDLRVKITM